jgi:hypothetical protein
MWDMIKVTLSGALAGKLFSNPGYTYGMMAAGIAFTGALCLLGFEIGLPLPGAAAIAAFLGGLLQPRLFKNIKLV